MTSVRTVEFLITGILFSYIYTAVSTHPNILLIIVDDLRPTLGCYNDKIAFTPNIDKFASISTKFNQAYSQQALCGPSRTSFLTSRRPDSTRIYAVGHYWRHFTGNFTTLPQHFKENGYITYSVGKIFHPGSTSGIDDDMPYSWSCKPYHPPSQIFKNSPVCPDKDGELHSNIVCPVDVEKQPMKTLPDIQTNQEAIRFLHQWKGNFSETKPFFLAVGYQKPHIPLKFPKKYLDHYPLEKIPLAPNRFLPNKLPPAAWNPWLDLRSRDDIRALNLSFPYGPMPDNYSRLIRQSYYGAVSYMDDLFGDLLETVNKLHLMKNTVVLFTSDHGWSLGEHQEWSKYSNFDVATKVPLILYNPAGNRTYRQSNKFIELIDIFPTLTELSGIPTPPKCPTTKSNKTKLCTQGKSFANIKQTKNKPAFSLYPRPGIEPSINPDSDQPKLKDIRVMGYSVRTKWFRYTEWVKFDSQLMRPNWTELYSQELYDHRYDSLEDNNCFDDLKYKKVVKKYHKMLVKNWKRSTGGF